MINDNNLKYQYSFLTEINSIIIRKTLFNLENNFKRYFKTGELS